MRKPIYRAKDQWVLCTCDTCGTLNYVEPHGTTARCAKCKTETEHRNIPYELRDPSGCFLVHHTRELNARPCANCGHGRRYHVVSEDHMRAGDCEHPHADGGFCKCIGYQEAQPAQEVSK